MKLKTILTIVLVTAVAGVLFSGYLSYNTLFADGCEEAIVSCGVEPIEIFGLPTCVYGLAMFIIVTILVSIALTKENPRNLQTAILVLSIAGVLFAGYLTYYEMFVQKASELPACAYGLILYIIILIFSIIGIRKPSDNINA